MNILGINAYHGDSSACIVVDGKLVAAVEEERFRRIKHWAGLPTEAVKYCLQEAKTGLEGIDYIAINKDNRANILKKAIFAIKRRPGLKLLLDRVSHAMSFRNIKDELGRELGVNTSSINAKIMRVEHHRAHLSSAFFLSEMNEAALVSMDGFGDFTSCMVGYGRDNKMYPTYEINFPHSMGCFYTAFTQFLGFEKYGDEYKVMGLAAYGKPVYADKILKLVSLQPHGRFKLDLRYFRYWKTIDSMEWRNTAPVFGRLYSDKLTEEFGSPREKNAPVGQYHMDMAASIQAVYEKVLFHVLNYAHSLTGNSNLCLAGGCALNSLANGKIFKMTPFKEVFIHPAAHDSGGAVGAAYYLYNHVLGQPRAEGQDNAYLGPAFSDEYIRGVIKDKENELSEVKTSLMRDPDELVECAAKRLADGKVLGWFQGRMEWGPRALGNRSILADPRRKDMKDILNLKIKLREKFRPFAPSILEEYVGDYFEISYPDPFMLKVYPIKEKMRNKIPAVTHEDGTGRLQTVNRGINPLYWELINKFHDLTGVPVLLNTSFNENEPIVCKPEEALDCFLRTKMDVLVLGNYLIERK